MRDEKVTSAYCNVQNETRDDNNCFRYDIKSRLLIGSIVMVALIKYY